MKKEIEDLSDIKFMVDTFYDKVNADDQLSPVFNEYAKIDWDTHLPKMYNFWNTILLSNGDYKGSPFAKHIDLPVMKAHFDRWLLLFHTNLDEHFEGHYAEEAKKRASVIGITFWSKIAQIRGLS